MIVDYQKRRNTTLPLFGRRYWSVAGSPRKRTRSAALDDVHSSSSKVHGVLDVFRRWKKAKGGKTGDLSRTKTSSRGESDGVEMV